MKPIDILLPEKLKYYRIKKKLTQSELAEKVNVSEHYISEIENSIKFPSVSLIKNISKVLDVPVYCLVSDTENFDQSEYLRLRDILVGQDKSKLELILDVLLTVKKSSEE